MILMVVFGFLSWSESFGNQIMRILSKHGALESCHSRKSRDQVLWWSLASVTLHSAANAAAAFYSSDRGSFFIFAICSAFSFFFFFNCLTIPFFRYAYLWLVAYGRSSTFGKFWRRSKCFLINISPLDVMTYILAYKNFSACVVRIFFFLFPFLHKNAKSIILSFIIF